MKVDVYRNLKTGGFSVRSRERVNYGRVISNQDLVVIKNARFIVQPAGKKKVLREKKRNVHAFIRGDYAVGFLTQSQLDKFKIEVTYNPFNMDDFYIKSNGQQIYKAPLVLCRDGKAFI